MFSSADVPRAERNSQRKPVGTQSVPQVRTLKKNKEFGYVYRRGKSVPKRDFTLIYVKSRYGGIRAGFSVSKKVGNAVIRNRARRRLKEAVRCVLPKATGHYAVVLVARPSVSDATFDSLVQQITGAFRKAGALPEQETDK